MKKQVVIISYTREVFFEAVKKTLDDGYLMVPESLRVATSSTSNAWQSEAQTENIFAVIMEKSSE